MWSVTNHWPGLPINGWRQVKMAGFYAEQTEDQGCLNEANKTGNIYGEDRIGCKFDNFAFIDMQSTKLKNTLNMKIIII